MYAMKRIAIFIFLLMFGIQNSEGQDVVNVVWDNIVNATANGNNLTAVAGVGGWSIGATGGVDQVLSTNQSWSVSMTAVGTGYRGLGVSITNTNEKLNTVDYQIYLRPDGWRFGNTVEGQDDVDYVLKETTFDENDVFILSYNKCAKQILATRIPSDGSREVTHIMDVDLPDNVNMIIDCGMFGDPQSPPVLANVTYQLDPPPRYLLEDLVFGDESAFESNTRILQYLINNNCTDDVLDLSVAGTGDLYIDDVYVTKDIIIDGSGVVIKRPVSFGFDLEDITEPLDEVDWSMYPNFNRLRNHKLFTVSNLLETQNVILRNMTFDGSLSEMVDNNQVSYENYEIEHSALVILDHPNNATYNQNADNMLTATLDNCTFRNNGSDGVLVFRNVNFTMTDSEAYDCFRGGLTCTGGNSTIDVIVFTTHGQNIPTGIDMEVNPRKYNDDGSLKSEGSPGNNGRYNLDISLIDVTLDSDLDLGLQDHSTFHGHNVTLNNPSFTCVGELSKIEFVESTFNHGFRNSNRILWPHDITFTNCDFIARCDGENENVNDSIGYVENIVSACPIFAYTVVEKDYFEGKVVFAGCTFSSACNDDVIREIGVFSELVREDNNVSIQFDGCIFEESLDIGFSTFTSNGICDGGWKSAGCNYKLDNCDINAKLGFWAQGTESYPVDIQIDNSTFSNDFGVYFFDGNVNLVSNEILFNCVNVEGSTDLYSGNIVSTDPAVEGIKILYNNNTALDDINGMVGDILFNNGNYYICEQSSFRFYDPDLSSFDPDNIESQHITLAPCEDLLEEDFTRSDAPNWTLLGGSGIVESSNSCQLEFNTCSDLIVSAIMTPATSLELGSLELQFYEQNCIVSESRIRWDTGQNSNSIDNLLPGEYCVTIRNDFEDPNCNECFTRKCFMVEGTTCGSSLDVFDFTVEHSSCGNEGGSIDLTVSDPCIEVTYAWSNGSFEQDITNLSAGEYCVTITRTPREGCVQEDCYLVQCFDVKAVNTNCFSNYCYNDIIVSEAHNGIVSPGSIYLQMDCRDGAILTDYWTYNNNVIHNFDLANIAMAGQYCYHYTDSQNCSGEQCYDIEYCFDHESCETCFSRPRNDIRSINYFDLNISPNPFTNQLSISSSIGINNIALFNINGRKVNQLIFKEDTKEFNLNTQSLTSGIYYMHILLSDGTIQVEKVVKVNN